MSNFNIVRQLVSNPEMLRRVEGVPWEEVGRKENKRSQIVLTNRPMRELSEASLRALRSVNDPPALFVRAAQLVHIVIDERDRRLVRSCDTHHLRGRMDRAADYIRRTQNGDKYCDPPMNIVNDILSMGAEQWPFPPLETVVEMPILRPDGTILSEPGYDRKTRVVYAPAPGLAVAKIKPCPDGADVAHALGVLQDAIGEFPYVDESSRANALALLLTPILRMAIGGCAPLALINAPQAGTGKSLLAGTVAIIATGREAALMPAPREDDEWRKAITASLSVGTNIVIYDNVHYTLQSHHLAMALTAPYWKDRVLGQSEMITVPQIATWIATGNNIQLGGDLARRCYQIKLDAKLARPWTRCDFKHKNLISWVTSHRGECLWALLTLARAWYASGKPDGAAPTLGSFEKWATTVAGILAHAGVQGFLSNAEEVYVIADESAQQWEAFLGALLDRFKESTFTVAALVEQFSSDATLRTFLPDDLGTALDKRDGTSGGFQRKLGKALAKRADTRFGSEGLHLVRAGAESRGGRVLWKVVAGLQVSQVSQPQPENAVGEKDEIATGQTNLQNLRNLQHNYEPGDVDRVENRRPDAACRACGTNDWWQRPDGGWVCGCCHPCPR